MGIKFANNASAPLASAISSTSTAVILTAGRGAAFPTFIKEEEQKEDKVMQKYRCEVCNYIYDPALGDPDNGVKPGTPFESLPSGWVCPVCGADKSQFVKEG